MEITTLIEEVRRRQVIWDTSCCDHSDKHKMAAAWRQICKICWPEFDTLPADEKRAKCFQLQKSWRNTKEAFIKDLQKQTGCKGLDIPKPTLSQEHYKQLNFLVPVITKAEQRVPEVHRAVKRRRTDTSEGDEPVASSSCGGGDSQESRERDAEEDRLFLLSLVSFMQDVPRASKLALRSDMIKLIGRYSSGKFDTSSSND